MSDRLFSDQRDPEVARMRKERGRNAVLKYKLATLRSYRPTVPVLAFEGPEDKLIYSQWIRRINPLLNYEPFPCSGKGQVFAFREMLQEDLGGLSANIYYFVDRDFDDMRGKNSDEYTFMTDYYATENYLVCEEVLEEVLQNEFHCEGRPDLRIALKSLFKKVYDDFLNATKEINFRMYLAKNTEIELQGYPPEKVKDIAHIELLQTRDHQLSPDEIIVFKLPGDSVIELYHRRFFDRLDPKKRYRGKYALQFFMKWLELLSQSYHDDRERLFSGLNGKDRVKYGEIVMGVLASRSPMPLDLEEFILKIN